MDEMVTASLPALFLFLYLLPGLLSVLVYGYLRETKPIPNFDRVVAAFALALVSSLTVFVISVIVHVLWRTPVLPVVPAVETASGAGAPDILRLMVNIQLLANSVIAILIAATGAFLNNRRVIAGLLIRLNLSNRPSEYDVWFEVFSTMSGYWVRLDFANGRTLIGWPKYYSKSGDPRELFISEATWTTPDGSGGLISVDVDGQGVYISDLSAVQSIAILK